MPNANWTSKNIFGSNHFVENNGQFDHLTNEKVKVNFAYIHTGNEIYLSETGFTFRLSKLALKKNYANLSEEEQKEESEKHIIHDRIDNWISLTWMNPNKNIEIIKNTKSNHYITYGEKKYNSYSFESVRYNNIYDGIDVLYEIHPKGGLEFTFFVAPGADIGKIKYQYSGQQNLRLENNKKIVLKTDIEDLWESDLHANYANGEKVSFDYKIENGIVSLLPKQPIDNNRALIIDPWVTTNTSLSGSAGTTGGENKAYDVDFDLEGNLFAIGGGGSIGSIPTSYPKIAKYDLFGNLLWTFSGVIVAPAWNSNPNATRVGNLVVNKFSGKTYMCQGLNNSGAQIIRLDPAGNYDNFITTADNQFREIWEMKFNCNTGDIVGMGGGTSSNINFGIVDTTLGAVTISNATGLPGIAQDLVCATLGPNSEVYTLFSAGAVANKILRVNSTYTGNLWNVPTGYTTMAEQLNKPYVAVNSFSNGFNALAANANYLFFYDGLNLKALNTATGATVGVPITLPTQTVKRQGGIETNPCDEVFIGGPDGNILKYDFDGTNFIASSSTFSIPGQAGNSTYDIAYNSLNNKFYVCGDQFVATLDYIAPCLNNTSIQLQVSNICPDSVQVSILNPDITATYTFTLFDSVTNTVLQTSTPPLGTFIDTFSGLLPNTIYTVKVLKNIPCQLQSTTVHFSIFCADTTINLCQGDSYALQNNTIVTVSGLYMDTFQTTNNLDSIVKIFITFHPPFLDTAYVTICNGTNYLLPGGALVSASGIYIDSFLSVYNCDSIHITYLSVAPNYAFTLNQTICAPDTFLGYSVSGQYIDSFLSINGCDSIRTLNLTVAVPTSSFILQNICAGDTFLGYYNSGVYIDTIVNAMGCDSVRNLTLTVTVALANFRIVPAKDSFCISETVSVIDSLSQPVGFVSYQWDWGDGTVTTGFSSSHKYNAAGKYNILLSISNLNNTSCSDTVFKTVTIVNENAAFFITNDDEVCVGDPIFFEEDVQFAASFIWNFGDNNQLANRPRPMYTYTTPGNYTVTLTTNNPACGDSMYAKEITVLENPRVNLGADKTYCPGITNEAIELKNLDNPNAIYTWSTGEISSSIFVNQPGQYWLQANNNGCTTTDSIWIFRDCYLNIPNSFSPNGDGLNDYFLPRQLLSSGLNAFTMKIMNRWGQFIFTTTSINGRGWDGKFNNVNQPVGVYVYMIEATWANGYKNSFTGNVTLMR